MDRRGLLNLALLAVTALLVAVVVFEPGRSPEAQPPPLTDLAAGTVSRIVIEPADDATVELTRENGDWVMRRPFALPANPARVGTILDLLAAESLGRFALAGHDPAEFGLDTPTVRVDYGPLRVALGGTTPLAERRYVRVGDTVHLVRDRFYYVLTADATELLDTTLLPPGAEIRAIHAPGLTVRETDDGWHTAPAMAPDRAVALFDAWTGARAVKVARAATTDGGEAVTVELDAGRELRFRIDERKPDLVLARPDAGVAYILPADEAGRLLDAPAADDAD